MTARTILLMSVIGLLLGLYEATAFTFSNGIFSLILPVIPALILLVVREHAEEALVVGAIAGSIIDVFAPEMSNFATARLMLIVLVFTFVARTVLTNHSLYAAIAMTIAARLVDRLWVLLVSWVHGWMSLHALLNLQWPSIWRTAISDACMVSVAFFFLSFLIGRFLLAKRPYRRYV